MEPFSSSDRLSTDRHLAIASVLVAATGLATIGFLFGRGRRLVRLPQDMACQNLAKPAGIDCRQVLLASDRRTLLRDGGAWGAWRFWHE